MGMLTLFRGAGKRGYADLVSTKGGVRGDGAYFYTDPLPARSHATSGGGVLVVQAPENAVSLYPDGVAVLKDTSSANIIDKIPVSETAVSSKEWMERMKRYLPGTGLMGATMFTPNPARAQSEALQEPTFDPTTLLAGPARWGGGLMNAGIDTAMKYFMGNK